MWNPFARTNRGVAIHHLCTELNMTADELLNLPDELFVFHSQAHHQLQKRRKPNNTMSGP